MRKTKTAHEKNKNYLKSNSSFRSGGAIAWNSACITVNLFPTTETIATSNSIDARSDATIVGTDNDDVIEGTEGSDVILGLSGNDQILA